MRDLAIVGMSVKLPGANTLEQFWHNLETGVDAIATLSEADLENAGISAKQYQQKNYVKKAGLIEGIDLFDAEFFEYTPSESELIDPQQRLLLEECWATLEKCGHAGEIDAKSTAVFATSSMNQYLINNVLPGANAEELQNVLLGNSYDCLATRIAYKLGLQGPAMTIQCGCSSSLVAIHQARMALLSKQCNLALVGAVSLADLQTNGYTYTKGGFLSPDGKCRPFDAKAEGTIFSSGVVVVALRRLEDAIADGDQIYACIKGSAINNDGDQKAGFTAPSVDGQARVIEKALRVAKTSAEQISYIEAHGTATPIGDPIEFCALEKVFAKVKAKDSCAIGSVKANIGHVDVAAGLAGLVKLCLAIKNAKIPGQLYFEKPNPKIDLVNSPFYIASQTLDWPEQQPKIAGLSSFGFGGTNAHVIVAEHSKIQQANKKHQNEYFLPLSAKTEARLIELAQKFRGFLQNNPQIDLADVAYTLQQGRRDFKYRYGVICNDRETAISELAQINLDKISNLKSAYATQKKSAVDLSVQQLAISWSNGESIAWDNFNRESGLSRIELPTHPVNKQSYWLSQASEQTIKAEKKNTYSQRLDLDKWLYAQTWQQTIDLQRVATNEQLILLFDIDNSNLCQYLQAKGHSIVRVNVGSSFKRIDEFNYIISPENIDDYTVLFSHLEKDNKKPQNIIHTWLMGKNASEDFELEQYSGFYSLLFIIQKLEASNLQKQLEQITTFTNSGFEVLGTEHLKISNSTVLAMSRVISQEYAKIQTKVIDLNDGTQLQTEKSLSALYNELFDTKIVDIVAYRNNKRWLQQFASITPPEEITNNFKFKQGGTYVILGGLGNVAMVHCEYLAKYLQANIILVNRSKFPEPDEWQTELSNNNHVAKITQLEKCLSYGANVVTMQADATDLESMQKLIQAVREKYSAIDGIIHVVGAKSEHHYVPLNKMSVADCKILFAPKVKSLSVLEQIVSESDIANVYVISSISSHLAGLGLCAYSASHNYIDQFIEAKQKSGSNWYSINWEAWNFHRDAAVQENSFGHDLDQLSIAPEEGEKILSYFNYHSGMTKVIVSTSDLNKRFSHWVQKEFLQVDTKPSNKSLAARPNLKNAYTKPQTELEHKLAGIWQDLLGIKPIGINDNFFELGGHSLLAMQLISKLNSDLNQDLSIVDLFDYSTVAKLAEHLSEDDTSQDELDLVKQRAALQRKVMLRRHQTQLT